jgi:predicted solute-binding protein
MPVTPRVCAVSYLNTAPLVWGLAHGPQRSLIELESAAPAECADRLRSGEADVGLVPIIELARQPDLAVAPRGCIACQGHVRSILLVCKRPFAEIESIAVDRGSRTSVVLAQILALQLYGTKPAIRPHMPQLDRMLQVADAALIIGDPALRLDPRMSSWRQQPVRVYDLGAEWQALTGLPMVFAVWAAKPIDDPAAVVAALAGSAAYGRSRIEDIVAAESDRLGFEADLVREYLTRYVRYELGAAEREAIDTYLRLAASQGLVEPAVGIRYLPDPD